MPAARHKMLPEVVPHWVTYDEVITPDQTKGSSPMWTHDKVFKALDRLGRVKHLKEKKAKLYPQKQDAAVLYPPDSRYHRHPIHLNPGRDGWNGAFYAAVWQWLEMNDCKQPDSNGYIRCAVREGGWDAIASAIGDLGDPGAE